MSYREYFKALALCVYAWAISPFMFKSPFKPLWIGVDISAVVIMAVYTFLLIHYVRVKHAHKSR